MDLPFTTRLNGEPVYDSTWSHSLHNLDSILRRLTPLALETDRMQTLAQCVPRGDRW
ncbi:unnamed protein product [Penicillium roqueforti FM164]|uniref:Genomic scaffold, ProqFM164S04 n=1 Tax=Penicillium roqueforti (strain FM164) TaxID=1365484 RepID=W6R2J8_PENRF|nr:unnamed protein product [Penicillium roqueforti FM164]